MRTLVLTSMSLLTACAWAGPPTVDLAGAWRVRLGEAEPVAIALPGTLGDADLGPAAKEPRVNILTPRHQYIGPATYSRTFTVPAGAEGAYELFLERARLRGRLEEALRRGDDREAERLGEAIRSLNKAIRGERV